MTIPKPTDGKIRAICKRYDQDPRVRDLSAGLSMLVNAWPKNNDRAAVLLKVCAVNQLYRTSIIDVHEVAETIFSKRTRFDKLLATGDHRAIALIRETVFNGNPRDNYSFATKYCYIHQPSHFPIFDSRVERSLTVLQKETGFCDRAQSEKIRKYDVFLNTLQCLRQRFSITCSHEDLDRFLYDCGARSK